MNNKEFFIKNKIEALTDRYKTLATLTILSIITRDEKSIFNNDNELRKIFDSIINVVKRTCREEYVQAVRELDIDILPDYLSSIKLVKEYQNILALQYSNIPIKDYTSAVKINKISIEYDSEQELPYFNILWILMKEKKYAEMIKICEIMLEFSPSASIYNFMRRAYYNLNLYGKAFKAHNEYVKSCPYDPENKKMARKLQKEMIK